MPRYRVKETSFFDGGLVKPGDLVEYDGVPGFNLEPTDAEGRKRQSAHFKSMADKGLISPNDPRFFYAIAEAVDAPAQSNGEHGDPPLND